MYSNECFWQGFHTISFLNLTYACTLFTNHRTIGKILHTFSFHDHLAPVVQRLDNFIRWIRRFSGSKKYFTLNVVQGFRTLPNYAVVRAFIFACTRGNTEIFAHIKTGG